MTAEERFDCMWRREFAGNLLANPRFKEKMIVWLEAARQDGIEEAREGCAKICDEEAEYYRSMSNVSGGYESSVFHRTGAKIAAHLAREIRARSS